MKLSEAQRRALPLFRGGAWRSAYDVRASMATLNALRSRGLLTAKRGLGSSFFPRNSTYYRITEAGRAALKEAQP